MIKAEASLKQVLLKKLLTSYALVFSSYFLIGFCPHLRAGLVEGSFVEQIAPLVYARKLLSAASERIITKVETSYPQKTSSIHLNVCIIAATLIIRSWLELSPVKRVLKPSIERTGKTAKITF